NQSLSLTAGEDISSYLGSYTPGSISAMVYGCCGIESQTDTSGLTTDYVLDELGRRIMVTDATGIALHTAYDALGNVTEVTREPTSGPPIVLSEQSYDGLGRTTRVTQTPNSPGSIQHTFYTYRYVNALGATYDDQT